MKIVVRADAAVHIGSGHVMRCLTLADELRERGAKVTFICRDWEGNLQNHIESKGYKCILLKRPSEAYSELNNEYGAWLGVSKEQDAAETLAAISEEAVDWCIADHYGIDAEWHRIMRPKARQIMVIDDIANRMYDCDVLLDQNLYDNPEARYKSRIPAHCRLLLGPEYALLRPEFREARERLGRRLIRNGEVKRIMVFFGGSDPSNETAKAVKALQVLGQDKSMAEIEADIVVGIANPHRIEIEQLCALSPNIHFHCQVPNMADFMMKADLAMGAGGSTTWERCCLGLPTLAVIIAENQAEMTETAARHGLQWNLGWYHTLTVQDIVSALSTRIDTPLETIQTSERIANMVSGKGVGYVATAICFEKLPIMTSMNHSNLHLRRAAEHDMMLYFEWANDPAVRQNAFSQEPIPLEAHRNWFAKKLFSPTSYLFVLEQDGMPIGQIRFDEIKQGVFEIDFSVAPEMRGSGFGQYLLKYGVTELRKIILVPFRVYGEVKAENAASARAFLHAGFTEGALQEKHSSLLRLFYQYTE
jgi:UDP-2,4-diacetamido-2,4,6-trideoxy-beta-L-altropyranose hydrolase